MHYLIDRKNNYYYVPGMPAPLTLAMLTQPGLHLPLPSDPTFQSFHQRTILDGELVLDRVAAALVPRFMVFDCLILDGELLVQKSFDRRIGRVHQFVHKPLTKCIDKFPEERKFFPFEVIPKPMEKPYALENVFLQLADLPHGNDGLIFTAKGAVYSFGTDEMIIKWKPPEENTVDFRLYVGEFPKHPPESAEKLVEDQPMEDRPEEPVGDKAEEPGTDSPPKAAEIDWDSKPALSLLVFWGRGDYRRLASLYCTDEEWQSLTRNREKLDGRIIECYVDDEGRWRYKREEDGSPRFRDDKTEANHISTVKKIMDSIDDGVSKKDLCAAQHLIYQAWKDRHPEEERLARAQQINSSAKASATTVPAFQSDRDRGPLACPKDRPAQISLDFHCRFDPDFRQDSRRASSSKPHETFLIITSTSATSQRHPGTL